MSRWRVAAIALVALLTRAVGSDSVPIEIHPDELAGLVGVANVSNASAPLLPFFDLRVQYLPLYGIVESLSVAVLGAHPFAMRLPAIVFGVLSVFALRWFVRELVADAALADAAAAIFAVLPWAIDLSRLGWEPASVFPFLLGALAALAGGILRRRGALVVASGALFGICAYTYRAAPFDGALLALAFLATHPRAVRGTLRALALASAVCAAIVAPLAIAVATHPHFFWRDAMIGTFASGIDPATLAVFARNYLAHFALGPLFATGDGILDHGPRYGVLLWWMLPFVLVGIVRAPRIVGRANAAFLAIWLAIYPLGGALTDDGVPDFPRTMIGAPLAAILCAVGVRAVWAALGSRRRAFSAALVSVAVVATVDFMRAYLVVYPVASATSFKFGTARMFATVRALANDGYARVCFGSLDWYNYPTYVDYYLARSRIVAIEGLPDVCFAPGSLVVVDDPEKAPRARTLLAVVDGVDGRPVDYVFGARAARRP